MAERLRRSKSEAHLVKLWRDDIEPGSALGYVEGIGAEWVMLCLVGPDIYFDGFQCVRISDITALDEPHEYADFVERALQLRGEERPAVPSLDLTSNRSLLESAGRASNLVTIHPEEVDPDTCFIGSVLLVDEDAVRLRPISPHGTWIDQEDEHALADITRVDVGARYEAALELVAASRVE